MQNTTEDDLHKMTNSLLFKTSWILSSFDNKSPPWASLASNSVCDNSTRLPFASLNLRRVSSISHWIFNVPSPQGTTNHSSFNLTEIRIFWKNDFQKCFTKKYKHLISFFKTRGESLIVNASLALRLKIACNLSRAKIINQSQTVNQSHLLPAYMCQHFNY